MIWTGWMICIMSLVAASFATKVWQLILTQGLGYGFGFLVLYYAVLSMMNEWFVRRRGLAYGIMFASAGISGAGLPLLLEVVLNKYSYVTALRGYAVAIFIAIGPTLPFCRGRLPATKTIARESIDYRAILTNPIFWALSVSNLFQGLAFYIPGLYLSLFAMSLGLSPLHATLLLCLLNLSQVIGQVVVGWLSDSANIFFLLLASTLSSAVFGTTLWYQATGLRQLVPFSILYGMFAGCFTVLYTRFVSTVTKQPATELWLYGVFAFGRGVGNVAAGPLAGALVQALGGPEQPTAYRDLIIFVGAAFILASCGGVGCFWKHKALPLAQRSAGRRRRRLVWPGRRKG
jgi:MFS family permease